MIPIDYDVTLMFYFDILGQRPQCIWTWCFVWYSGCKPIAYDIHICLLVLGVDPEAHDWWDVLCWAKGSGAMSNYNCVEHKALEHMKI